MSERTTDLNSDPYVTNHPQMMPFWNAAEQGCFILPRCMECERVHWYPRPFCPFCMSRKLEWIAASGKGTVYSFTVMRKAITPYVLAYVQIEEGPSILTNIIGAGLETVHVGQPVKVSFKKTDYGRSVPVFSPI